MRTFQLIAAALSLSGLVAADLTRISRGADAHLQARAESAARAPNKHKARWGLNIPVVVPGVATAGVGVDVGSSGINVGAGADALGLPVGVDINLGNWNCDGSGTDGKTIDNKNQTLPAGYPLLWLWFGVDYGWGPPKGWQLPSDEWKPPALINFEANIGKFGWWAPSHSWRYDLADVNLKLLPLDVWLKLGWYAYNGPPPTWNGDGSGTDGYPVEPSGLSVDLSVFEPGFLYFGAKLGWLPPKNWHIPSTTWSPTARCAQTLTLAVWWAPTANWMYPSWLQPHFPLVWLKLGWHSYNGPAPSFVGSGSGTDGWKFDPMGNSAPANIPAGWLYFGVALGGWQPPKDWAIPNKNWNPPAGWNPLLAVWFAPLQPWYPPQGFKCPQFWKSEVQNLLGVVEWIV